MGDDWLDVESYSSSSDYEQSVHQIAEVVERECSFLRFRGHSIFNEATRRKPRRGVAGTVRFYVTGLPSAKRAKWTQPLCRSVMAMLQRCSCTTRMQGGELYMHITDGMVLRLEF